MYGKILSSCINKNKLNHTVNFECEINSISFSFLGWFFFWSKRAKWNFKLYICACFHAHRSIQLQLYTNHLSIYLFDIDFFLYHSIDVQIWKRLISMTLHYYDCCCCGGGGGGGKSKINSTDRPIDPPECNYAFHDLQCRKLICLKMTDTYFNRIDGWNVGLERSKWTKYIHDINIRYKLYFILT